PRAFPPVHTPRRRPALEQRGAVHPSAELLELRTLGLHVIVLLAGRSRGLRVRHPLHFALWRPGDREAGGGARAPKAAAKRLPLRRRPAQAVAALPCPSLPASPPPRSPAAFCERRGGILRTGASRLAHKAKDIPSPLT